MFNPKLTLYRDACGTLKPHSPVESMPFFVCVAGKKPSKVQFYLWEFKQFFFILVTCKSKCLQLIGAYWKLKAGVRARASYFPVLILSQVPGEDDLIAQNQSLFICTHSCSKTMKISQLKIIELTAWNSHRG